MQTQQLQEGEEKQVHEQQKEGEGKKAGAGKKAGGKQQQKAQKAGGEGQRKVTEKVDVTFSDVVVTKVGLRVHRIACLSGHELQSRKGDLPPPFLCHPAGGAQEAPHTLGPACVCVW